MTTPFTTLAEVSIPEETVAALIVEFVAPADPLTRNRAASEVEKSLFMAQIPAAVLVEDNGFRIEWINGEYFDETVAFIRSAVADQSCTLGVQVYEAMPSEPCAVGAEGLSEEDLEDGCCETEMVVAWAPCEDEPFADYLISL